MSLLLLAGESKAVGFCVDCKSIGGGCRRDWGRGAAVD